MMIAANRTSPQALQGLLRELLAERPAAMARRVETAYDEIAQPFQSRLVICGTGRLGRFVLPGLRAAGIQPLAFCDNNPALNGKTIEGVPVLSPREAARAHNGRAAFLLAVYNASGLRRQLESLECARIVPYPVFFWKHWLSLPWEKSLELPQRILERAEEFEPAYELLADEQSRREFLAQIRWRCLMDYACLPPAEPASEMYFPRDIVRFSHNEIFADCGAFDGEMIRSILEKTNGRFRHIYAIEPDPANLGALARYIESLPGRLASRIELLPYAVGNRDGIVRFDATSSVISKIAETGTLEVACRRLDSALRGRDYPTYIKMDIEGAEIDAVPGAATIARLGRPVIAACASHRAGRLWQIPPRLKAANRDYKIFLRRYAEECWGTAYYAVPPERLVSAGFPAAPQAPRGSFPLAADSGSKRLFSERIRASKNS